MEAEQDLADSAAGNTTLPPFAREAADVVASLGTDAPSGLSAGEAAKRLEQFGPNEITSEKPPSVWAVAFGQFRNPMNIMLVAVVVVSFAIGEVSTGIIVALLILLNVVLGSRQELKARASVTALSNLQVPQAKVVRDGTLALVPAVDVVPGDIVQVEAGDIVPADGRILRSATLETQEAALTGESAPVGKDAGVLPGADVALGDRSNMLFQNTSVTRGTASMVVTATGMQTQMGQIATMLTSVTRTRSPLQKELDSLTKVLGIIAWTAVAFIFVVGLARGMDAEELFLLGTAMAISAIPTGSSRVRLGAAVVGREAARGRQGDREEPDRRRDAGRDERDQHRQDRHPDDEPDDGVGHLRRTARWFTVEGEGYRKTGRDQVGRRRSGAGLHQPGARHGARQRRDGRRRRRRSSAIRPRRRWWCCRPSSTSTPKRRAGATRVSPRCPSTPSTSSWRPSTARRSTDASGSCSW